MCTCGTYPEKGAPDPNTHTEPVPLPDRPVGLQGPGADSPPSRARRLTGPWSRLSSQPGPQADGALEQTLLPAGPAG